MLPRPRQTKLCSELTTSNPDILVIWKSWLMWSAGNFSGIKCTLELRTAMTALFIIQGAPIGGWYHYTSTHTFTHIHTFTFTHTFTYIHIHTHTHTYTGMRFNSPTHFSFQWINQRRWMDGLRKYCIQVINHAYVSPTSLPVDCQSDPRLLHANTLYSQEICD